MKIYLLDDADSFLTYSNDESYRYLRNKFMGRLMLNEWTPLQIEDTKMNIKRYDFCRLSAVPVFNERSFVLLKDILGESVEYLRYEHKVENYYAVNVLSVIDCVDLSNSQVVRDEEYNVVKDIKKYEFIKDAVENEVIFKTPHFKSTRIFVTDRFRDRVLETRLTGFEFLEVWDSV